MTRVLETDDSGALTISPELLGHATPHARFVVESAGNTLMLRPETPAAPLPRNLSPEERARDFVEWVESLPPGPGLSDAAVSRDSIYE